MSDNITLPREVVQGALEALVYADSETRWDSCYAEAITALRAALAAPSEDIETLRRENERLREALKLALNSHGRMLMSDPPQDPWKVNRVDEVIRELLQEDKT